MSLFGLLTPPWVTYEPKVGYKSLDPSGNENPSIWWRKPIWKFECPAKSKIYTWLLLNNMDLAWEILQKQCFKEPGSCCLYEVDMESNFQLIISYPYSKQV